MPSPARATERRLASGTAETRGPSCRPPAAPTPATGAGNWSMLATSAQSPRGGDATLADELGPLRWNLLDPRCENGRRAKLCQEHRGVYGCPGLRQLLMARGHRPVVPDDDLEDRPRDTAAKGIRSARSRNGDSGPPDGDRSIEDHPDRADW